MRVLSLSLAFSLLAAALMGGQWISNGPDGGRVNALAIDPTNASHLLAGTDNGLFATTDAAASWTRIHDVDKYEVTQVAFDPADPSIVYAAYGRVESYSVLIFRESKLFRSEDGGASWSEVTAFGTQISISSLEVDRQGNVYLGFRCGIEAFKGVLCETCATAAGKFSERAAVSNDHGETWESATGTPADRFRCFRGVTADPERPGVVYAHSWNMIAGVISDNWVSDDGGRTFVQGPPVSPGKQLLVHPSSGRRFAANGGGTYSDFGASYDSGFIVVSDDQGATWHKLALPGTNPIVGQIALDPASQYALYLTTNVGLYYTPDLGVTWERRFDKAAYAIVVTPSRIYLGTEEGLMISPDLGTTWSRSDLHDGATTVLDIAVDPNHGKTLYAWLEDYEQQVTIAASTDGGSTWQQLAGGFPAAKTSGFPQQKRPHFGVDSIGTLYVLLQEPSNPGVTTLARRGVGESWWTVLPYPDAYAETMLVDPTAPRTLYVFALGTLMRKSVDGGDTWSAPQSIIGNLPGAAAIDPTDSRLLFVTTSAGLQRSRDGGTTWTPITPTIASVISISPADHHIVWTSASLGVIEKSNDSGTSWETITTPIFGATGIVADAVDPNLVYIWSGSQLFRSSDGGMTWQGMSDGMTATMVNSVVTSRQGGLYAATFRRGVFTWYPSRRVRAVRPR